MTSILVLLIVRCPLLSHGVASEYQPRAVLEKDGTDSTVDTRRNEARGEARPLHYAYR